MNLPLSLAQYNDPHTFGDGVAYLDEMKEVYRQWIEQFNRTGEPVDVDFRGLMPWFKAGDQLTHHIHPYPAKLLPHIAHFFISIFKDELDKDDVVLDPFCGSGTVALEASLQSLKPCVVDANPLALLITKVKTTPYNTEQLRESFEQLQQLYLKCENPDPIEVINADHWYLRQHKLEIERLSQAIKQIDSERQEFFFICLSVLSRKLSFADPCVSVPVKLKTKEKFSTEQNAKILKKIQSIESSDVWYDFSKVVEQNIKRVQETNCKKPTRHSALVVGHDAREIELPDQSVALAITSPPYGSAQKYVRASSLSLNWLQLVAPSELLTCEGASIGRERLSPKRPRDMATLSKQLPEKYEKLLDEIAQKNTQRAQVTKCYLIDMLEAAHEISRVLKKGGRLVIVIGNNQVAGIPVRNDHFLIDVLHSMGVILEVALIDHIRSRGLMTKRNKTASVISREEVLIFFRS